ncbi:sel1 repeat family protein [Cupriavidus sp. BIS7]|uniref:SEL1-like repeat protein n=1 Tax=Cupriavidus sp. BIS7 TaxID=1217718 RepID=UPI00037147FF|nr:sel1 repeat family protein [Cupriavidus sp. BIS7]
MPKLPDFAEVRADLAFSCIHEADHLPPLDPEADQLFQYARYLQKRNGPKDFDEIVRHYRIAAAHGHYKANHNAQLLVSRGKAKSPYATRESIDWATQLVEQDVPMGYYDVGHYLKLGYGFKQNEDMALRYIRKAADMGNPEAQYYVSKLLAPASIAPDIARQMRRCAAEQGHGEAAVDLGYALKSDKLYRQAAEAFQLGVAAGDSLGALKLEKAFDAPPPTEELRFLALPHDPERVRRYKLIRDFLHRNEPYKPKIPDIDQIVPLPPAELPPWDGTFQWEKEQAEAVPPEKPSDELIRRLSRDKGLDPATGLPLPPPPRSALGTCVNTGERCPESGLWRALGGSGAPYIDATFHFSKGNTMPVYIFAQPRLFALLDRCLGPDWVSNPVQWQLVGYDNA